MRSVAVMRNTCGKNDGDYIIVEQEFNDEGHIYPKETNFKERKTTIEFLDVSKTKSEVKMQNFRGYDVTTIFKCKAIKI